MSTTKHFSPYVCLAAIVLAAVLAVPCRAVELGSSVEKNRFPAKVGVAVGESAGSYTEIDMEGAGGKPRVPVVLSDELDAISSESIMSSPDELDDVPAGASLSWFAEDETFSLISALSGDEFKHANQSPETEMTLFQAPLGRTGTRKVASSRMLIVMIYCSAIGGFALLLTVVRQVDGYLNYRRYREWKSPKYPFVIADRTQRVRMRTRSSRKSRPHIDLLAHALGSRVKSGGGKKVRVDAASSEFCQKPLSGKTFMRPRRPKFTAINALLGEVNIAPNQIATDT